MKYIYDILVNYKYPLIDFYEWNKNDNIINLKKTPVLKINKEDLQCICCNHYILDNISDLYNKAKTYDNNNICTCIFTDEDEAVAFLFNKYGKCVGKSRLLLDEEKEAIEIGKKSNKYNIKYKKLNRDKISHYKTIKEVKKIKYIAKKINQIKDKDKLDYIYFDCFNEIIDNPKKSLLSIIDDKWDEIGYKLYDFFHIK